MLMDRQRDKKKTQTNKRTELHKFRRNLAMMVFYLPVKFEFDWTMRFRVRVWKRKCWWTDKRTKNGQTNGRYYANFERNLPMMVSISLSMLNSIGQSIFE